MLPLAAPALPLDEAGKYVAAAYLVFLALVLLYVAIIAIRLRSLEREALALVDMLEAREGQTSPAEPEKIAVS
jgi:hypothetical protein